MDALEAEQVKPASSRIRLPFGFAKRHGVLLQQQSHGWQLYIHTATAPAAVLEVRRMLAEPFQIARLSAVEFEAMLEASYQRDSSEAQQLMEDIGNEVNLASLADDIQESEDLLENEDDAPGEDSPAPSAGDSENSETPGEEQGETKKKGWGWFN